MSENYAQLINALCIDLRQWLKEHNGHPIASRKRRNVRNQEWFHMVSADIMAMPDKWESPWFAAWDLAFHCVTLAGIDPDFAKDQIDRLLRDQYLHPSGQIPAYEWNFGDVNPPLHAWATGSIYQTEKEQKGGAI